MYFKSLKVFTLLFFVFFSVSAQRSNIVLGPELNLPTGNSTNQSPIGFGGYLKGEFGLSPKFSLTASGAIENFIGKRILGPRQPARSYVPIKAGLKYYTERNFYLEGQVGASFPLNGNARTAFAWSPGIGTFLNNRNNGNQLDIGFRYEGWTSSRVSGTNGTTYNTFGFFTLRAGYAFNL